MISLEVQITDVREVSPGVYETSLSHPQLKGTLTFTHKEGGGKELLSQINCSKGRNQREVPYLLRGATSNGPNP